MWPVMVTPFDSRGAIDWAGYASLIDFYLRHGAAGLFAVCGSSEALQLTPAEMLALTARTLELVAGRVPVVAGALRKCEPEPLAEWVQRLWALGPAAVVLSPSVIVEPDEDDATLQDRIGAVTTLTGDIPLGIYEWPKPYRRLLSPDLLGWIARTGRFVFHKDTCSDIGWIEKKLRQIRGTPLKFFNANLATLVDSLLLGADGYCGIGANYAPEAFVRLCRHTRGGTAQARRLQTRLLAVEDCLCRDMPYPRAAKELLALRGVSLGGASRVDMRGDCRGENRELNVAERDELKNLWRELAAALEEELRNEYHKASL